MSGTSLGDHMYGSKDPRRSTVLLDSGGDNKDKLINGILLLGSLKK